MNPLHISPPLLRRALWALALGSATLANAQDVDTLLRAADRYRAEAVDMQVQTQVAVYDRDGKLDKERLYTVLLQSGRRSLVLMRSPAEKGQKVLMLGDDFWLLMPGSQRPMRITPMQKLLGDASTGDVATMQWVGDYAGTLVGEEACASDANARCLHLSLRATRKGVTYQRMELWLGKNAHEPVRADLYVHSDKLAKQARFVVEGLGKPGARVTEMVLGDRLSTQKETRIRYQQRQARQAPAEWFNPMFLAHSPNLE